MRLRNRQNGQKRQYLSLYFDQQNDSISSDRYSSRSRSAKSRSNSVEFGLGNSIELKPKINKKNLQKLIPKNTSKKVAMQKHELKHTKLASLQSTNVDDSQQSDTTTVYQISENIWNQDKLLIKYKPETLIGRKIEKQQIGKFINQCLLNQINNRVLCTFLFLLKDISGCPGVGKTATTHEVIVKHKAQLSPSKVKFGYINALKLRTPSQIYRTLLSQIQEAPLKKANVSILSVEIQKFLKKCKRKFFIVIDQVDYLYTKDQSIMYNLVEWSQQLNNPSLALIMIANTIDYPERLAAKITSRMGAHRICFRPYSNEQIYQIVKKTLAGSTFFTDKSIEFISKKFSGYTSDLRKIFEKIRSIIKRKGKQGKKIGIEQVSAVWAETSEENHEEWRDQMPQYFKSIIQVLKRQGGKSHTLKIFRLLKQNDSKIHDIESKVFQLSQMGIVSYAQGKYQGYKGFNVTLKKI